MTPPGRWLRERLGTGEATATMVPAVSFAYVFGRVLVMLLAIQGVTGAALAAFYAASTTDAWASVAYIQDRVQLGWLIRGLHHHGAAALVIVSGIHLVQTALFGAYKKPRELTWWLGIILLLLVLGFAVTGYVLRWDQAGFWANQVEVGIAAGTPIVGGGVRKLLVGGNDYGNLTLTRFYALHVVVLPALAVVVTVLHVRLAGRHGVTPRWDRSAATPVARWPRQTLRDVIAIAIGVAILLGYVASTRGADLAAPADPSSGFDARPLWYFRWLFALRSMVGSLEGVIALVAPAVVVGFLVALPVLDTSAVTAPATRKRWLGALAGMLALIGLLTIASYTADSGDAAYAKRQRQAALRTSRARALAASHGVPATGAQDLFATAPMFRARMLFKQRCAGCHDDGSKDRKGPIIGPGHGSRAWLRGYVLDPSGPAYWGKTKLAKTEDAMKPVDVKGAELDDLVEAIYAESGALDIDANKRARGRAMFDQACTDCHSLDEGVAGGSGPGLGTLGSRDWYTGFIGNPKSAVHLGPDKSEMPRFDKNLSIIDRDALAGYLMWLRGATKRDVDALDPI